MTYDRNGLEVLDRVECVRLLARTPLGRLGVTSGALPVILPVNFLVDGERILVRTGRGTKLDSALAGNVVAFEADAFDPVSHTGWSVVVTGVARRLDDLDDLARVQRLPLPHWAPNHAEDVVAISMELVSGRRLGRPGCPP